jgi:hypothetical protein
MILFRPSNFRIYPLGLIGAIRILYAHTVIRVVALSALIFGFERGKSGRERVIRGQCRTIEEQR